MLRNSITIIRGFEKQNATLAGVLGKTKGEINELVEDAKRLGETTVKSASEVTKLQTAYARLGFSQREIINLTESTINGSIALNSDLESTSKLVGAVVNSFDDLSTTDAPKILETLAASTTKTALNFGKLEQQLPIVSGAANAVGLSLDETVSVLGKLSDAGIDASSASTAFRNILIESAARGIDYRKAIEEVRKSTDKLSKANELFGKRAAVSAVIIANNTDAVGELTKELEDAAVVQRLVDNELNTLDGSLKLLKSAWEGFVLSLNDATDGGNVLGQTIRFLAENLQTIFKVIGVSTSAYLTYVIAVKASNLATKAGIVITKGATIATNAKTIATNVATTAQRAFNTAVKANPLGLLLALLAAAITAYLAFRDSASDAIKAQRAFDEGVKKGADIQKKAIEIRNQEFNDRLEQFKQEAEISKVRGENAEKVNKKLLEQEELLTQEFVKKSQEKITQAEIEIKSIEENLNRELDVINKRRANNRKRVY